MASPEAQTPHFQWERSHHGTWERDIDECETFYKRTTRKEDGCYPMTGSASFITTPTDREEEHRVEDALRKAWVTLCYEQPNLRSYVKLDDEGGRYKRVYSTLQSEEEHQSWLNSSFKIINTDVEPLQWFNDFATSFELSTLFFIKSEKEDRRHWTIFLRCDHTITDGVGILLLIEQLFGHAAQAYEQGAKFSLPEWGNEYSNLSPCLRLAAQIPQSLSESHTKRFNEIQTRNGSIYTHPNLLGLPSSGDSASPGKRHRTSLTIPQGTTKQILQRSKAIALGVNVTHVFVSALALALTEVQPKKEEPYPARFVYQSMVNLRPYCREPYNTPSHAAAPYHTISAQALGIDTVVSGPPPTENGSEVKELSHIASDVRDFFKPIRPTSPEDDTIAFAPLTFKAFTGPPDSDPHAVSNPPFCPVALSSIGNVDSMVSDTHGVFKLTDVWAASEPIGAGVATFLETWDGKIQLSATFDTQYHDAGYIEGFLGRILHCVYRGLDIKESNNDE
ncbi:hypothetical protein M426DRAFT_325609 [Hypoxylon sp. CI-4A]|nr:hypothetical protein M426DRAFT_325609 [Hypoxylon sp. CI-4A]